MSQNVRKKLLNTLQEVELKVEQEKSRQGLLGQLAAQQRVSSKAHKNHRERRREVDRQVRQICQFDSAVRSILLNRFMQPSWSEIPNAFKIESKLTQRQRRRLQELTHKRLEFK